MIKTIKTLLLSLLFLTLAVWGTSSLFAAEKTTVYFFWGDGCPHCAVQKPFLEEMEKKYPELEVKMFETWQNPQNANLFQTMAAAYDTRAQGVPTTFIGDYEPIVGFAEYMADDMESKISTCINSGCVDPGVKAGIVKENSVAPQDTSTPTDQEIVQEATPQPDPDSNETFTPTVSQADNNIISKKHVLKIPLLGTVNISQMPLVLMTALVAFVDGFNPCSLWVITFLLGIVVYSGSRKKVFIVGLTFITMATLLYGLFVLGLFNTFALIGYMLWIKIAVAAVALIFGLVNIKDYFWYKKGISFTIPDRFKPKIFKDTRGLMKQESMLGLMLGTIVMSFGVTFIELICTAGFPVIWTSILAENHASRTIFAALFALYMLIYFIDEFIVFGAVLVTLKASRFEENQGRVLKLIGGIIMLSLAFVWLTRPELMNEIGGMIVVFGGSITVAIVILILHRKILPRLGIHIGTQENLLTPDSVSQDDTTKKE